MLQQPFHGVNRPACIDVALVPIHQDEQDIRRGREERSVDRAMAEYDVALRERRARAWARVEVRRCVESLIQRGRPVRPGTAEGLADIAVNTYIDAMKGTR